MRGSGRRGSDFRTTTPPLLESGLVVEIRRQMAGVQQGPALCRPHGAAILAIAIVEPAQVKNAMHDVQRELSRWLDVALSSHLASALVKIAYGIVKVEDTEATQSLLRSSRHLGVIDVKNAGALGLVAESTEANPGSAAEAMLFETVPMPPRTYPHTPRTPLHSPMTWWNRT